MKIRYREIRKNLERLNELGLPQEKVRNYLKQAYTKKFTWREKEVDLGLILWDYEHECASKEDTIKLLDKLFPKPSEKKKEGNKTKGIENIAKVFTSFEDEDLNMVSKYM